MRNNYQCDICGCFLNPDQWKYCDKCQNKANEICKKHNNEVIRDETGTQDD